MGQINSIASHIRKEIDRLNELVNSVDPDNPRKILTLDQLGKVQQLREQEVDLHHIGILFCLDKNLKGYFEERDFVALAETCLKNLENWKEQNFQQQLQAYCTLNMWNVVCGPGGDEIFAKWFCKLLECSSEYQHRWDEAKRKRERDMGYGNESSDEESDEHKPRKGGRNQNNNNNSNNSEKKHLKHVGVGSVQVLHKLLMLEELYGMSKDAFVDLCMEVAREKKYSIKNETVPLAVLNDFAIDFVRGLTRLLHRLGFSRGL